MTENNEKGFTIIELLVSLTVFSVMLLIATMAMIQISKMYYKGINNIRTQELSRDISASIVDRIRFTSQGITPGTPIFRGSPLSVQIESMCIGTTRYSYILHSRLVPGKALDASIDKRDGVPRVLWQDTQTDNNCEPVDITSPTLSGGRELMAENTQLVELLIAPIPPTPLPGSGGAQLVNYRLKVLYGDNDLLDYDGSGNATGCGGGIVGSQWCASAELTTQVMRRAL